MKVLQLHLQILARDGEREASGANVGGHIQGRAAVCIHDRHALEQQRGEVGQIAVTIKVELLRLGSLETGRQSGADEFFEKASRRDEQASVRIWWDRAGVHGVVRLQILPTFRHGHDAEDAIVQSGGCEAINKGWLIHAIANGGGQQPGQTGRASLGIPGELGFEVQRVDKPPKNRINKLRQFL